MVPRSLPKSSRQLARAPQRDPNDAAGSCQVMSYVNTATADTDGVTYNGTTTPTNTMAPGVPAAAARPGRVSIHNRTPALLLQRKTVAKFVFTCLREPRTRATRENDLAATVKTELSTTLVFFTAQALAGFAAVTAIAIAIALDTLF